MPAQHWLAAAVAVGVVVLALASESAPAPRETYTIFAIAIWAVAILGTLVGALPRAPLPRTAIWAGALLAAFTALTALSLLWASDPGNAYDEVIRASGYTGLFVVCVLASRDGEGGWWLRGLAIGLVAIAVIALAPRLLPDLFGTPDTALDAQGRIGYPIRYWNGLGALMAAALALLAWLSVEARSRAGRVAAFAAISLPLLVLYMAQSRGGLLAALAALAVLVGVGPARQRLIANLTLAGLVAIPLIGWARAKTGFLERPGGELAADQGLEVLAVLVVTIVVAVLVRRILDRRLARFELGRNATIAAAALGAVVALAVVVAADPVERFEKFKEPPTQERLAEDVDATLTERSGGGRWQFWGTAVDAFADEPLHGIGAGEFGIYWNRHGPFGFQVQDAHSLFLEALGELGIAGLLLIAGFFGVAAGAGAMRSSYVRDGGASVALALLAAGAVAAMFDFAWELPAVFAPVVIVAALLTGSALTPALINAPDAPPRPPRRPRSGLALAAATLVFGWATLVACGLLLLTDRELDRSRDAVSAGNFPKAVAEARDAVELMPFSAEPRVQLGLAYMRAGDYVSARKATLEAIDRAGHDWRWWRQLGIINFRSGDLDAVCRDIARARQLNPRQAVLYQPIPDGPKCPGLRKRPPR